ncbi:MAG: nuclear transport factor 2 family protein [Candidatus Obscuribacterales bacterium]|nr:nuclear transport factor 2 family protein [Candidatus Obscuribacterales bacterium]
MDLQYLIDRQQIVDTINKLATFADLHQWDALSADVFASELTVDYTSLFGGEPQTLKAVDLVSSWKKLLPGFESTQHLLGNHLVTINGAKATAMAAFRAHHFLPNKSGQDSWVVGGYYNYELQKQGSSWRICKLTLNFQYTEGNQELPALAQERAKAAKR